MDDIFSDLDFPDFVPFSNDDIRESVRAWRELDFLAFTLWDFELRFFSGDHVVPGGLS